MRLIEINQLVHESFLKFKNLFDSIAPTNPLQGTMGYQVNSWFKGDLKTSPTIKKKVDAIYNLLRVEIRDIEKIRVGQLHDGGYFVSKDHLPTDGVICLGVGSDISFEKELQSGSIRTHFYDDSVCQLPEIVNNATFFQTRVGKNGLSLDEILSRHNGRSLLLKCDIEGSEWDLFDSATKNTVEAFHQIVIEFHHLQYLYDDKKFDLYERVLSKLGASHIPIHTNSNNFGDIFIMGGSLIPEVLEVTYLNRKIMTNLPPAKTKEGLSNPNNPNSISFRTIFDSDH